MLKRIEFQHFEFDEEIYAKSVGRVLTNSHSITELSVSHILFTHPKSFYDVCASILNDRCRLNILKLKGININQLEGKIIQFILMKNKSLSTIEISHCKSDSHENYEYFLGKIDQFCNVRNLTIENLQPDIS